MFATDAVRLVAKFLREHPTYGVEALLSRVTPEEPDQRPPTQLAVYNEVEDACVADKLAPDVTPALVVIADAQPRSEVQRHRNRFDAYGTEVTVLYFSEQAEWTAARQDWKYVAVAVGESLTALFEPKIGDAAPGWRRRGQFGLVELESLDEVRLGGGSGTRKVVAGLVATMHVIRDLPTV